MTNDEILSNIKRLREEIEIVKRSAGRESDNIRIVGACKTMSKDVTDYIIDNHLLDALGDNKVQELIDKYDESRPYEWHFIGNLQTNKVKYIIDKVSLIHSLDRSNLAAEINKQAKKIGKVMDCLIEINIAKEESKGGIYPENVYEFADTLKNYSNIRIVGIMSVLPNIDNEEQLKEYFIELNCIFDRLKEKFGEAFTVKSMGMTNDYKLAIKYGSNMIRIGRLIFGERRYI